MKCKVRHIKKSTIIILLFISVLGLFLFGNQAVAKKKVQTNKNVKTKKMVLCIGDNYQLKHKKGMKYKSSSKKIATVSKKGTIVVRKNGNCIIKVIKNARLIKKYKLTCCLPPSTNGARVIIDHIEKIDDELSYVYCVPDEDTPATAFGIQKKGDKGIDMIKIITKNSQIVKLNVSNGDCVAYIYSYGLKTSVEGNVLNVYGDRYALMYKLKSADATSTPIPTAAPSLEP